ncbi:MAG: hypothetical protein J7551_08270 [Chloroflexi bacterium]|jgi:hypothetical protein|nr:hypothetical protein [Chloroflexota bacterium]
MKGLYHMLRKIHKLLGALLIAPLAACGAPEPTPTPTLTPTPTPSNTPRPTLTLPPTWTPTVFVTNTPRAALPTLNIRPTITPAARRTENLGALVATPIGGPPTVAPDHIFDVACLAFARSAPTTGLIADRETNGQVSWTPVEGAEGYRVWLLSPAKRYVFVQDVTETTVTFKRELFTGLGNYAWEVMPLRNGDRFCQSLTGVIVVRFGN